MNEDKWPYKLLVAVVLIAMGWLFGKEFFSR